MTVLQIVVDSLGTIPKDLGKKLEELKIKGRLFVVKLSIYLSSDGYKWLFRSENFLIESNNSDFENVKKRNGNKQFRISVSL